METQTAEQLHRTSVVLWFSLLSAQILFLVVVFVTKKELFNFDTTKPVLGDEPVVPIIFAMLALMNLGLSFFMKSQSAKRAVDEQNPRLLQTGTIIACAFCESISIMGLILAFAFHYHYFFLWFALGIFGILLHFPKRSDFLAADFKKSL
jgi:F0F1-type ATP synthase membrane subunit c/vacuolar-type H+-ATPase subunit K